MGGISFKYGYDSVGNLTYYLAPEGNTTYLYDARNFLTKAFTGTRVYSYTYDGFGNILSATDGTATHTYTYGDKDWKDLLTAYDGKPLTYDGAGNPLTYQNGTEWKLTWEEGRKLSTAKSSKGTVSYGYDLDGTRGNKTVNGVTHYYLWEGGRPLKEYVSGNTGAYKARDTLYYFYDHNGRPFMLLYNGEPYYYILNLQGDVYRMVDSNGTTVAQYRYDPWGKVLEASGRMAEINPLRYRGYYYDSETGWYYLNSRYYDPAICRFINADGVGILTEGTGTPAAKNLFSYCDNNPVIRKDDEGTFWETAFDVISLGASIVEVCVNPVDPWAWAGLVGDTIDLIPFVTGVGEVTRAVKTTVKVVDKATDVVDTAKDVYKAADAASDIRKATGSYEIVYKSGKNYIGKGNFQRAITSAKEHAESADDILAIRWKSAPSSREAFIDEYLMQKRNGGVLSSKQDLLTYNKIWSPGRRYYGE